MSGLFDDEKLSEKAERKQFAKVSPATTRRYEKIEEDLEARHAYGEAAAKEHAKEALEDLYNNEFPIDDPPASFERYEAELAVQHLRESVEYIFEVGNKRNVVNIDVTVQHDGDEVVQITDWDGVELLQYVERSKKNIDVMATYGSVAEPHIAALTAGGLPPEVSNYAAETLADLREGQEEPKSLTAAIRDWWHGGK